MITVLLNNRYQTIQVIGAGGFGETFLAEDTYLPSRRHCVIKQLKPITNRPQLYQTIQDRFGREAATLELLGEGSAQIPRLYAYFCENEQFYLVQEWIQGQTLASKVATEGTLSETVVREILLSLLPVIEFVHSKGIIHRDIKPANIILRRSNGEPVLIDFGAVKETMVTAVTSSDKSAYSIVIGTPTFMAPEQATGRPIYASDIYSLGMTAIYLLTGKTPHQLETDLQTEEILWQQHAAHVSPSLTAVLGQAIQYHPRDRFSSATQMLEALQKTDSFSHSQAAMSTVLSSTARLEVNTNAQHELTRSPSTTVLGANRPSWERNTRYGLILAASLASGWVGAAMILTPVRNQFQSSTATAPLSTLEPEQPVTKTSPFTSSLVAPVSKSPKPISQTPTLPKASLPPQTEKPSSQIQPLSATQPNKKPQPQEVVPTSLTNSPQPTEQKPPSPKPQPIRQKQLSTAPKQIVPPGFTTGTPESKIRVALGNPTKSVKSYFPNTSAVLYEFEPIEVTLSYIFDNNSRLIRQTEATFAQSVDIKVMRETLYQMLGDRTFIDISQALEAVYQHHEQRYAFIVEDGNLEGVIERNQRDRIYISVWEADLH